MYDPMEGVEPLPRLTPFTGERMITINNPGGAGARMDIMYDESAPLQKRGPNGQRRPIKIENTAPVDPNAVDPGFPKHFYVASTPGWETLVYAGSVKNAALANFYTRFFSIYGPTAQPADVDVMKNDFRTKRSKYRVELADAYHGERVTKRGGRFIKLDK